MAGNLINTKFCVQYKSTTNATTWLVVNAFEQITKVKAMDDIGVVMTPFGDVVTVILVVNSYVFGVLC